jgi:hypothetical protein
MSQRLDLVFFWFCFFVSGVLPFQSSENRQVKMCLLLLLIFFLVLYTKLNKNEENAGKWNFIINLRIPHADEPGAQTDSHGRP